MDIHMTPTPDCLAAPDTYLMMYGLTANVFFEAQLSLEFSGA